MKMEKQIIVGEALPPTVEGAHLKCRGKHQNTKATPVRLLRLANNSADEQGTIGFAELARMVESGNVNAASAIAKVAKPPSRV